MYLFMSVFLFLPAEASKQKSAVLLRIACHLESGRMVVD